MPYLARLLLELFIAFPLGVSIIWLTGMLAPDPKFAFHWMAFAYALSVVRDIPLLKPT